MNLTKIKEIPKKNNFLIKNQAHSSKNLLQLKLDTRENINSQKMSKTKTINLRMNQAYNLK